MMLPSKASQSIIIFFLLVLSHGSIITHAETKIGAIVDVSSRIGKEQKVAMEIAVENFNKSSSKNKLALLVETPAKDPLQAAYAAEGLIKEKQVQTIIGMETWHEAALVAEVAKKAKVPVISLAGPTVTLLLSDTRWPSLVKMATTATEQVNCIAAILNSYKWKRVIAVYEDDAYGGDSGMVSLLSEAIQISGTEIEHRLVFPPLSSISEPESFVSKQVTGLLEKESRVFVVLKSSVSLATHLFREAKKLGLVGRDSVWIVSDSVSSLLDSFNSTVISTMQGVLGVQTYFPEETKDFLDFKGKFQGRFRLEYPEEDYSVPGLHALRAYDGIRTISEAVKKLEGKNTTPASLLEEILSSDFRGLSGDIRFQDRELSRFPNFRIVNVIGKMYNELGFWSQKFGFSDGFNKSGGDSMQVWDDSVNWPGKLKRVPKGWAVPSEATPMKIVIPGKTSFEKFVKVNWNTKDPNVKYTGFCIDIFTEVLKILEKSYPVPYDFYPVNDTYDGLVNSVINQTYDAVVGDITILANRSKYVEFTQPFAESGLSLVVPVKSDDSRAWMFVKPFTKEMWIVTGLVMIYTMMVVWLLEHQSNPEFRGPWKDQLSNALWFTFSSLFFAHKEKIQSSHSRVVVALWFFIVFVVTSSYQASLTSMLTVPRLEPTVNDIEHLRTTNSKVGVDGDSFVLDFMKNVLVFKDNNIIRVGAEYNYQEAFHTGRIKAAFLELPYEKVFLRQYCNYTATGPTYRFGGLGFVFQKGSPIAADVSEAILIISENGVLKDLEEKWFVISKNCSNSSSINDPDSLNLQSFWGLYTLSAATSTISVLFYLYHELKKYRSRLEATHMSFSPSSNSLRQKLVRFVRYVRSGTIRLPNQESRTLGRAPTTSINSQMQSISEHSSAKWEMMSPSEAPDHFEAHRPTELELPTRTV